MAHLQTDILTPEHGIAPSGYRLPAQTRLGRVRLQVADLDRSIGFYEEVLGLRLLSRRGPDAELGAQGDDSPLLALHELPGAAPVPRRGLLGLYHFAVLLPDRAALGRFAGHLVRLGIVPGLSDHLVSEALYLSDLDGLGIEVYADRPRGAWRYEGRQLVMSTEPLFITSLPHSDGREPWSGAPAGTTIGHVHLYVGDLERAEAFYHQGLGFDKTVWSYPGALFLSAGGYHHHLGTNTWAAGSPPAGEEDARLLEWEIIVPDAGDVAGGAHSLHAHGYEVEWTDAAVISRDPWGTPVRVRST